MHLLDRFMSRHEFSSYEDFAENCRITVPKGFNFAHDVVDVYAAETPDKTALVWCDDGPDTVRYNFREMALAANRAANAFRKLGIGKGDPVMLILKGRHEFWPALLALHKLGAIAIPATHMLTAKDIVYRIKSAGIRMILAVDSAELVRFVDEAHTECPDLAVKAKLGGGAPGWSSWDGECTAAAPDFVRLRGKEAPRLDDILMLYFTSGTAGHPKMVRHDYGYPLGHILTARYWQNVLDDGLHYTVADTGWAKAMWGKIYGQWLAGSGVFVYDYDRFNAALMLEKTFAHGVTTFCAPPTIYRFLIKEDLSQYDFSSIKYAVTAGEPLNAEVYEQFLKKTGLRLMEGYGQTETVVIAGTFPWMEAKPGSMGKPTPLYDIALLDHEDKPVEVGEEGEICIRTAAGSPPGMFSEYYRDRERTESVWHDGWYHTGDMAWRDEDGYLWFIGRADDVIKSSGYRIGPFEVESALITHPAVVECAITGVPDDERGMVVKATIVLAKGYVAGDELARELQRHVQTVTAPYKYPRIIEFVDQLPKTISGKIRRVQIRETDSGKQLP